MLSAMIENASALHMALTGDPVLSDLAGRAAGHRELWDHARQLFGPDADDGGA